MIVFQNNVPSFAATLTNNYKQDDIATAVTQGVSVDILIDSGWTISLISESVNLNLTCHCRQKQLPRACKRSARSLQLWRVFPST